MTSSIASLRNLRKINNLSEFYRKKYRRTFCDEEAQRSKIAVCESERLKAKFVLTMQRVLKNKKSGELPNSKNFFGEQNWKQQTLLTNWQE